VDGSDIDIRGVATNQADDILCMRDFDHYADEATDTTVYSLDRVVSLLLRGNAVAVELLGCKPEHYLKVTPTGQELLDNRKLFLSKTIADTYEAYAIKQLRDLKNAIARDRVTKKEFEGHVLDTANNVVQHLQSKYPFLDERHFRMYIEPSEREGVEQEIYADICTLHVPMRTFNQAMRELHGVFSSYDRTKNRDHGKDDLHLNKHALHLVRAYLSAIDLMETGDVHTCRENERELLLSIRAGKYLKEDKTYDAEFFDLVSELKERLDNAVKHSDLPPEADHEKVRAFVSEINRRVVCDR
jgi:hypothetical protein